jgi:competence protein ComEA
VRRRAGTLLLVVCALTLYGWHWHRATFPQTEKSPVFFVAAPDSLTVALGAGFLAPGIHQFFDGADLEDVIRMAAPDLPPACYAQPDLKSALVDGESLELRWNEGQGMEIKRGFMSAGQLMTLGVRLHPDRMSLRDWEALPGIGPKLAERIEEDRQKNGDFGVWSEVRRVKGIGPRRIEVLEKYF